MLFRLDHLARIALISTVWLFFCSYSQANSICSRLFRAADGLSGEVVSDIVRGHDGAIWFATWGGGISRYDGRSWEAFGQLDDETKSPPGKYVRALSTDAKQGFWATTPDGLAHFDGFTWANVPVSMPDAVGVSASCIMAADDGALWVGTDDGRVLEFRATGSRIDMAAIGESFEETQVVLDGTWRSVLGADLTNGKEILDIFQLKDGTVLAAIGGLGIFVHDGTRFQLGWTSDEIGGDLFSLVETCEGSVWGIGDSGLYQLHEQEWRRIDLSPPDPACLAASPDGRLLVGTKHGLWIYEESRWTIQPLDENIPYPPVKSILCLEDGIAWIGTNYGAARIAPKQWVIQRAAGDGEPLTGSVLYADSQTPPITVDSRNRLLRFNGESWQPICQLQSQEAPAIAITRSYENRVWILFETLAVQFSLDRDTAVRSVPIPSGLTAVSLFQTKTGRLYLLSSVGAYELIDDKWQARPADPDHARSPVCSMEEDEQGRLWVVSDGLVEIWEGDQVVPFPIEHRDSLQYEISMIHNGRDNRMWIGVSGLGLLDSQSNRFYTVRDGLLSNEVSAILQTSDRTLWVGGGALGISSFRDGRWVVFGPAEGVEGGEVSAIGEYPEGTIWVALKGAGVARYHPTREEPDAAVVECPQRIAHQERGVFSFSGLDMWNFTPQDELVYSWRILYSTPKDVAVDWSPYTHNAIVVAPRLQPDKYIFQVRAADKDRNTDLSAGEAVFEVLLPIWRTHEFLLVMAAFFVIVSASIFLVNHKHRSLLRSEKKYRDLVESINDIIFLLDESEAITYVSSIVEPITGYAPSHMMERSFLTFVHSDDQAVVEEGLRSVLSTHCLSTEFRFVGASDNELWMLLSARPNIVDDRIVGVYGVLTDITARKQAEVALHEANTLLEQRVYARTKELEEANEGLRNEIVQRENLEKQLVQSQKMEAVGHLAGGVAHDFNNLLTVIIGNLSFLKMGRMGRIHERIGAAQKAAERAANLVQQLLAFSRKSHSEPNPLDINELVKEVYRLTRESIDRRIEISVRPEEKLPKVLADATQMHSVLVNLCVNARDAIVETMSNQASTERRKDSFVIAIETRTVVVTQEYCNAHTYAYPGEFVVISVADNGAGMNAETRNRIFEPFFTTKEVGKGSGLGLASAYGIVKQHKGWITVDSEVGEGTTFNIYLPSSKKEIQEREGEYRDIIVGGTETILLVDDEEMIRDVGKTILEDYGYTVLLAADGEEALNTYESANNQIDLIVLDLSMPNMSGREVLEQLHAQNSNAKTIISSGYSEDSQAEALGQLGAVGFISKPYHPAALARKIREILDNAKQIL
ncbi:MAG: response regulator [bacterium]